MNLQVGPDGEIGRHSGLKIRRPFGNGGSSPPPGTKIRQALLVGVEFAGDVGREQKYLIGHTLGRGFIPELAGADGCANRTRQPASSG